MRTQKEVLKMTIVVTFLLFLVGTFGLLVLDPPGEKAVDTAPQEMYYQGFYDACVTFMTRIQEVSRDEALINCDKVTRSVAKEDLHQKAIEEPNSIKRWLKIWSIEDGVEKA